jgi:hypothetical protein
VRAVSEQEEGKEENVDVERATSFFRALYNYFKQNPKSITVVLRDISENLIDTIIENGELRKDLGFTAGQLKVVSDLFWYHDDEEIIQQTLINSPNLEDIMNSIAQLATAYTILESNTEIIPGDIENLIKDSASTLYRIIEYIITDTGSDP